MKKNVFRRFRLVKGVQNSTTSQKSREGGVRGVLNLEYTCCMRKKTLTSPYQNPLHPHWLLKSYLKSFRENL